MPNNYNFVSAHLNRKENQKREEEKKKKADKLKINHV
jgi:hypothetical protein